MAHFGGSVPCRKPHTSGSSDDTGRVPVFSGRPTKAPFSPQYHNIAIPYFSWYDTSIICLSVRNIKKPLLPHKQPSQPLFRQWSWPISGPRGGWCLSFFFFVSPWWEAKLKRDKSRGTLHRSEAWPVTPSKRVLELPSGTISEPRKTPAHLIRARHPILSPVGCKSLHIIPVPLSHLTHLTLRSCFAGG